MIEQRKQNCPPVESAVEAASAEAHYNSGNAMARDGKMSSAIQAFQCATLIAPDHPDYHLALAQALYSEHRFQEAVAAFGRVLELRPSDLKAHIGLGIALHRAGDLPNAVQVYSRALHLQPTCAEACTNLGLAYQDMGDLEAAIDLQRQAIGLSPGMASAHNNLGVSLLKQGKSSEALACFLKTLTLKPDHAGAQFNTGYIFQDLGFLAVSEKYYERALSYKPQSETLRFYLGMLHLLQGNFSKGWRGYEFRWGSEQQRPTRRSFPQPQWKGEELRGESILLHAEQGLGDTMQFVRYASLVAARGGHVVLEVQPPLLRLMKGMEGVQQVLSTGDRLPEFRWQCPLMSLPLAFNTKLESIPYSGPYLHANAEAREDWAQRLRGSSEFRIGLAWGGNPKHLREKDRSIPLAQLATLTSIKGTQFYSLQKGPATAQIQQLPRTTMLIDLDAEQTDFADTAAIVANLDLVISIDTSVAHLAGGLGKPVWVLLHSSSDWRWLVDREDSPWYPTARLFRKSVGEDWEAVVGRLRLELEALVGQRSRQTPSNRSDDCEPGFEPTNKDCCQVGVSSLFQAR